MMRSNPGGPMTRPMSWCMLVCLIVWTPASREEPAKKLNILMLAAAARQEAKASGRTVPAKGEGAMAYNVPPFESPDVADNELTDGDVCVQGEAALAQLAAKSGQPFFLAVGFHNPHVPWVAPKKYW